MLKKNIEIGSRIIGPDHPPYVIAEAGSNFNQDLDVARRLIDVAVEAKVDAIKFQLFRAELLYPKGGEIYQIFKSIELNPEWLPVLIKHANDQGIQFMASAFDKDSVRILESQGVLAHKIASSETVNLPLVHFIASQGKPIFISTGMCDMVDIEEAVNVCLGAGNSQVILLQCGAQYPIPSDQVNLRVISTLMARFQCPVGFSDHTLGQLVATTAVGLGAAVFEKHFTLDRTNSGPDHFYALEPAELKSYVLAVHEAYNSLGSFVKELLPKEKELGRREGLYAMRSLKAGEVIKSEDIAIRRPALGLRSRYFNLLVGARTTNSLEKDQAFEWNSFVYD